MKLFLPADLVENILLSILLMEIFDAGIGLEEAELWFRSFFSLENRGNFRMCYDMYLYKTNHFLKLKINS